ncbi:MAG: carbohydrate binding family 9 domain-containing protein [Fimbriimonadaceae bacterium]|nr:carbohydrate binding family 9 domain-containing protein [Fimbriimonadaceae bacterium]
MKSLIVGLACLVVGSAFGDDPWRGRPARDDDHVNVAGDMAAASDNVPWCPRNTLLPNFARVGNETELLTENLDISGSAGGTAAPRAASESSRRIAAAKLAQAPVVDGKFGEGEWAGASKATTFYEPNTGKPADDQTDCWLGFDDQAIYVAFHCHDSKPESIHGQETRPGVLFDQEDYVAFRIDPFFTRQEGQISRYLVNAIGTQTELIAGGRAAKREWRGDWQSAVGRVSDGWVVEMRIPWSILKYPAGSTPKEMTVNFGRHQARTKVRTLWCDTTSAERPEVDGIWEGVITPAGGNKPKIQLLPYTLLDVERSPSRFSLDAGLDIRYPFTSQLTGVGSINPDFKNVEQAVESIAFTRSERYLGDSRPFFAEGSDDFNLSVPYGIGRLFYSRRIDDFDVGAKVYGRANSKLSTAGLVTYGAHNELNAVARVRQDFSPRTNATAFATAHRGNDLRDTTTGAAFYHRSGNYNVQGEIARSDRSDIGPRDAFTYALEYNVPNFFGAVRAISVEPEFDPVLGLTPFNDMRGYHSIFNAWKNYPKGPIQEQWAEVFTTAYDHYDGHRFDHGYNLNYGISTRTNHAFRVGYENRTWDGSHDAVMSARYAYGGENRFRRYGIGMDWGQRSGEKYQLFTGWASQRLLKKLDLGIEFVSQRFQGVDEQLILTAGWEIDPKRAISGRLVRTSGGKTNAYLAYRSSGFKGAEVFVILGDPNAASFRTRVAVKVVIPIGG